MKTDSKPIVLIVDDDEIVLKLLERQLAEALAPNREERWGSIEEFARAWSEVTVS